MTFRFVEAENAPVPMGPYSSAVTFGDICVTAGQLPIDPATGEIVDGGIVEQTRQTIKNLDGVLQAAGLSLKEVVKLTVFLTNMDDLVPVAGVRREFWSDPHPVSTTVECSRLANPKAVIEIDVMAVANRS